ncbi:MAG: hypothetical protein EXQ71_01480 [Acidimicrobiia bacterium]|nr:hypothetical protein [Acidimicrobiia bacterium]
MSSRRVPPGARRGLLSRAVFGSLTTVGAVVMMAAPASAHNAGGDALPEPLLLGYGGAAALVITALVLWAWWPSARLARFHPAEARPAPDTPLAGGVAGILLLALVLVIALAGVNTQAGNPTPWVVGVVFWVGLPLSCVLCGDVFRWVNPFATVVRLLPLGTRQPAERTAPPWVAAAFLFSFIWYFLAYYRPGSPRALAMFLLLYSAAALGTGWRWGHRWLATGEGFGALSSTVARVSPWGARGPLPPGIAPLMTVWLGGVTFDLLAESNRWVDLLGSSRGWGRTLLDTAGLAWATLMVAALYLLVVWVAERGQTLRLAAPLGVALIPLATGWFLAHDLSLLLTEGRNALILASDPLGRGNDLFGTVNGTIDYGLRTQSWLRWSELALVAVGNLAALVVFHDTALSLVTRSRAARATVVTAAALSTTMGAGVVVVLG